MVTWSSLVSGSCLGHVFQSTGAARASGRGGGGHLYSETEPADLPSCPDRENTQDSPLVLTISASTWYWQ